MKIIAFGASSSTESINKQLASYAAKLAEKAQPNVCTEILDLNDFALPLFSQDKEAELGQPAAAQAFYDKLSSSDAIIISFAEHNGSYTAAYKNLFDWTSRINQQVFQNKPLLLLATSPGPGGAKSVLASATDSAFYFAGEVIASISIPNFFDNFDTNSKRLINDEYQQQIIAALNDLLA
ncbi:NAD(P)H-dependent FMN reductase [Colwellia chukchiensis]|uniref:NAD(P)H-dependent FMN reductase n=1 Tax=Colwellia chukchiensis TaxID=641665 RepID=A0A1H7QKZ6_9GAMM|nr:NAD(P)H-dependent oxidoreductase [Colwellia chukchiensis]SEL48632.1 NAD(P)H-dependent FMN reductase [Colwellia chukchiensis]